MLIEKAVSRTATQGRLNLKGVVWVLLGATFWGTLPIFSKYVYAHGSDPMTAAAWRSYLAASVFLLWFLMDGTLRKLRLRDVPFFLCVGVFAVGGTFILYMKAVETLPTAMAAMLLYTAPSFVILLNRLFRGEPITGTKLTALLCTFFGCVLVTRAYDRSSVSGTWQGLLFGLGSGFCYSLTTVLGGQRKACYSGRESAGFMVMFSPVVFLIVAPPWRLRVPTPPQWAGYLGLAVMGSVLAYVFYMKGLATGLDGSIASITATVEPVIATVLGMLLLGDALAPPQVAGMLIVLAGVALPHIVAWRRRPEGRQ